jgi:hypothetical protein
MASRQLIAVAMRQIPNELRSEGRNRSLALPVRIVS